MLSAAYLQCATCPLLCPTQTDPHNHPVICRLPSSAPAFTPHFPLHPCFSSKQIGSPPRGHAIFELTITMLAGSLRRQAFSSCQARYLCTQHACAALMTRGLSSSAARHLVPLCPSSQASSALLQHSRTIWGPHTQHPQVCGQGPCWQVLQVCTSRPPTRPACARYSTAPARSCSAAPST